ncbi:MAG TPA: 50S ribosomal protein L30 [Candidatus Methanofastidiosa archaeon]|nr:50S ribosomal protein L30 [Candidatus Methanofastidiosa archaeon]
MKRLAVIRIRGEVGVRTTIKDTLGMLKLFSVGNCVLVDDRDSYRGMLQKSKDYLTFGEIDAETLKKLVLKWGRLPGNGRIDEELIKEKTGLTLDEFIESVLNFEHELDEIGIKDVFRLHPPRGGYKDTKRGFGQGGSLGYRGEEINALLKRMI